MRNRRAVALLAAAMLLLCRLPAYALEGEQGGAAAPLDSGYAGTEAAYPTAQTEPPPPEDTAPEPPPDSSTGTEPPENSLGASLPEDTPLDSQGAAPPAVHAPEVDSGVPGCFGPLAQLPTDHQPDGSVEITLTQDWVIGDEQGLTTLSPQFADKSPSELANILGHPGITQPVTIQTKGHQIVVRDGGSLILSEFDLNSAQLHVEGEHEEGLFYVESGGRLVLNQVLVEAGGVAVYLEEGADYTWTANNRDYLEPKTEGEAAPLSAVELHEAPEPLPVFDDTVWNDELPAQKVPTLEVFCSVDGQREQKPRELAVIWDTEAQADALALREDCVLEGWFPDGEDGRVPSFFTPELPVRFLPRGPVQIQSSRFWPAGDGQYFGELSFQRPHEPELVRLEVSEEESGSWREVEDAVRLQRGPTAQFYQPDARPRLYRIAVEGGPNEGVSEPVTLPSPDFEEEGDDPNDDTGGNRGGGTALDPPERELASSASENPADALSPSAVEPPTATPAPSAQEPPASAAESTSSAPNALDSPSAFRGREGSLPAAGSVSGPSKMDVGQQAQTTIAPVRPRETPREPPRALSLAGQAAAAVAGAAACGGAGALVASQTLREMLISALRKLLSLFKQ